MPTAWIELDSATMTWAVMYWSDGSPIGKPCTLGSTDLTTTLIFAEVEGVTGG